MAAPYFDGEGDSTELFLMNTDGAKNMILMGLGVMDILWNQEQCLVIVSGTLQVWPMKGLIGWERPHPGAGDLAVRLKTEPIAVKS